MRDLPDNLSDWLTWIEALHPQEVEMGLSRVRAIAERLGLIEYFRQSNIKVITIAGTNGKGSTAAMLEKIACVSERSVGCFSSPHFLRYNERIRLNGVEATDEYICQVFSEIALHTADQPLTYFEYGTLAALQTFKHAAVEFVILEVGLGGRLDAANIIDADIAVITSIGIDHQDWLGDDREQIGFEKAGILRAYQPLVCSETDIPDSVVELMKSLCTSLYVRNIDFSIEHQESRSNWQWHGCDSNRTKITIDHLTEPHIPKESTAAALQAIALLDSSLLTSKTVQTAISTLRMPGRFFNVPNKPIILDVAHNPDAAAYLANQLKQHPVSGKTIAVFGVMADKDLDGIVTALQDSIDFWYLAALDRPRAAQITEMVNLFERQGIDACRTMTSVNAALAEAETLIGKGDRLLVVGSFFTVAAALDVWGIRSLSELL
ncbi:MAG: bifunctional tetrahydrofolate synthase/dihydrofolate synthase [Pseudomonadales bacterium]|nr:bifunctional tetrahydrofolate synthase/dihydrofolate synthase [Pseudomonadales bacterium]